MCQFDRGIFLTSIAVAAGLALASAVAATLEADYLAARDAAIAKIKAATAAEQHDATNGGDDKVLALDGQARAALERQMRAIIGPVTIKGMAGKGVLNLDTLSDGDEDFGLLDGLVYGAPDAKTRIIVTTDGLFQHWLQQHRNWTDNELPQQPDAAVRDQDFYTQAVLTDAAIVRYADLPIAAPAGAIFAYAMLAARTQSELPPRADEIFIAVSQGGRTFIAFTKEFKALRPIAACDAIRLEFVQKADDAAQHEGDDSAAQQQADALSAQADEEFLRCFSQGAPQQSGFAAAIKAAQALLDRLPAR